MEDIGTRLREARGRQNLTLAEVAARTRIPAAVIGHIEHNAFDRLPGAVFTKAHLRAYATAVGLEPEEIVQQYLGQFPAATRDLPVFRVPPPEDPRSGGRVVAAAVGIATILFAYNALREPVDPLGTRPAAQRLASGPGEQPSGTLRAAQPIEMLADAVAAARPEVDHAHAIATAEHAVRLDVAATGECWVSIAADGEVVLRRLLQEGERATIGAATELVVRVGDPATFAYTLNGAQGRLLGDAGKPVTVTITEDNYHTFLDDSERQLRDSGPTAA